MIGTAENPIPCGRKIIIKLNGNVNSRTVGALPGSIPFGAKFLGGFGGIQMHGCTVQVAWSNIKKIEGHVIEVEDDLAEWKVGHQVAVTTSDYEQRHTEYLEIIGIEKDRLTLSQGSESFVCIIGIDQSGVSQCVM